MEVLDNNEETKQLETSSIQRHVMAQLLLKHCLCEVPKQVPAQFESALSQDRDLLTVNLKGIRVVHIDALVAELRKALEDTPLRLANIVCTRDALKVLMPPRPTRNLSSKRRRALWDTKDIPKSRRNDIEPLPLEVDEHGPLGRAQGYLVTDLSELRHGDRPLAMELYLTDRGLGVSGLGELRLTDLDYLTKKVQLVAVACHHNVKEVSVDLDLREANDLRVSVNVVQFCV